MKIDSLTIRGFRGFNQSQTIKLHPNLNIIYGHNSYGKTSITEAVEWLLYGETSKVAWGESKDEYKGSYRNCHIKDEISTSVEICFITDHGNSNYKSELMDNDNYVRYIDGKQVTEWPIDYELANISKPFIMQHALKYLLLVNPDARFKGFAQLLGLDELGNMQSDFVSVCTKPTVAIPHDVSTFLATINSIESRLATRPDLKHIYDLYKKGKNSFTSFTNDVFNECKNRVPIDTPDESVIPSLLKIHDDSIQKFYSGSITLTPYSSEDIAGNMADVDYFIKFTSEDLVTKYCELITLKTQDFLVQQIDFYQLGLELLRNRPTECPFCGRELDNVTNEHIKTKHQEIVNQSEHSGGLLSQKQEINLALTELKQRLDKCQQRHISRINTFLLINDSFEKLSKILLPKYEAQVTSIRNALNQLQKAKENLTQQYNSVCAALTTIHISIHQSKEDVSLIKDIGVKLIAYSKLVSTTITSINTFISPMADANAILKHELDSIAGTEDISLLVELYEKNRDIKKAFDIEFILEDLKELRKKVDQYVGIKMLDAVMNDMTKDVMDWYSQIRTSGDPDVHFSGFDMERTKKGEIKSRRVQIKASSYGKELVSAVSSLSESKLNALGLCLSIATNLKSNSPFNFIFIDDPIQSWDEEHEVQFIEVLHSLIDQGKQIILLSHNKKWLNSVREGCHSINGFYYEITSYNKDGPNIVLKAWCDWRQRLDDVNAILNNNSADSIILQTAEGEIRLIVAELTSMIYFKNKKIHKDANNLNASKVRTCLIECGIPLSVIDRIGQTFNTTDDAHHVTDIASHRARIRCYHSYAHELSSYL
jgi:hypothetical protein